jgi:hypothetical protein
MSSARYRRYGDTNESRDSGGCFEGRIETRTEPLSAMWKGAVTPKRLKHENSVVGRIQKNARPVSRASCDSDGQREFRWTFQCAGVGAGERAPRGHDDGQRRATLTCHNGDRNHTSQVVMQRATLIVWIIGTMLVLSVLVAGMMMVDVIDAAALAQVGSNILLGLQGMLNVSADQWHDARGLGQHEERQEERTKAS